MRKQDLYNFIEMKTKEKQLSNISKIDVIRNNIKKALNGEISGLDKLAKEFSKLVDVMEKTKEAYPEGFDWGMKQQIQHAYNLMDFKNRLVDRIYYDLALEYLKTDRAAEMNLLKDKYPASFELIQSVKNEIKNLEKNNEDLHQLARELNNVIKNSKTAKDGHKNLIALGVDMEDFQESNNLLPSIQKLSVDVCVINDNCAEGSA